MANEFIYTEEVTGEIVQIPVELLHHHPDNPRKNLGDLTELADSIKAKGILQNLTVVPRTGATDPGYYVVIGNRRMEAAKSAGLQTLPCVIASMTYAEQVQTMLLENMQRVDLTVYEQAQGFQMMLDLGDSIETVSEKTGFSQTTVRRRLKMMELDQEKLKEVSDGRQISLADFDELAKIEDIAARNKVLADIGTANFNQSVATAMKKQKIAKNLPLVKEAIEQLHAKKLSRSETWNGKYTSIGSKIWIHEWDPETPLIDNPTDAKKLFYYLDEDLGEVKFYIETPKAKQQKRPQAEIDREKYIAETRAKLDELTNVAFELRREFVANLSLTKKNEHQMLEGAIRAITAMYFNYVSVGKEAILKKLGIVWDYGYADESKARFLEALEKNKETVIPEIIYSAFADNNSEKFYSTYCREFPKFRSNLRLEELYAWLISLGYEMSDDERSLRDGTHPLFVDKDRAEDEKQ